MENKKRRIANIAECVCFILILIVYPLRHIHNGIDMWDGGYNYANFHYSGLKFMDAMWYFATWLSNQVGRFFTRLPFGDTCVGMNVYTGLVVSAMAVSSFLFCVKRIKMPAWMAFLAQLLAISLCWAPTAMLYSYLTYAFLLAGTIFLYRGLADEKNGCLIAAGVLLGLNVGNRFSNLVQTGLILAVWVYGIINKKKFREVLRQTGFCVLGYVSALVVFLGFMALKYGIGDYVQGILRLFQMTEHAEDYTPGYMLIGMVWAYYDCMYFLKRFVLTVAVGLVICAVLPKKWKNVKKICTILVTAVLCVWLSQNYFYTKDFTTYDSIYYPCVVVLTMTLCLSFYMLADKRAAMENKLLGILLIPTILITTLGGNNAIYSSINNMFLIMPGFLWLTWRFCREKVSVYSYPFKCILIAGAVFLGMQGILFGRTFAYEEATGGRNLTAYVEEIPKLQGMKTAPEKAQALTELYAYLEASKLREKRCVIYGRVPGLAYYMDMAPAMNIWGDLRSYGYDVMERDLKEITDRPVILLSAECAQYVSDRNGEGLFYDSLAEQKMQLLCSYIEENGYKMTFCNEKFAVFW